MSFDYSRYLRAGKLPHIWCPGCAHGTVMKSILRAIDKAGWKQDETVVVSGIGCASRLPGYVDFNTLHTTHGRALGFATGIKLARPRLNVLVVSGDGDALAIGGNHFIHACRRNIDLTLVVFNNNIYGMTGGQFSPTTPPGRFSSTTPYGNPDPPFDVAELAMGAGATYVARGTAYHVPALDKLIADGMAHKGFSVIDALCTCPTAYGRRNKLGSGADMLEWLRDNTVSRVAAEKLPPEKTAGKMLTGVFRNVEKPEYCEAYGAMRDKLVAK
jgi:2-oxoglutarate/2-oxoacid ferredoxin oxidoreductase subunit beta